MGISKDTISDTRTANPKVNANLAFINIKSRGASVKLQRFEGNPIISPNPVNQWENFVTTNPGACYDKQTGAVNLLYRAAGNDSQHVIRFGRAISGDGYHFKRFDEPVFSPSVDGLDGGCIEDPRIVKMGQYYYITYATRVFPPGEYWLNNGNCYKSPDCAPEFPACIRENHTTTHLLITKDFKNFIRAGRLTNPMLDDRDVILFPEKIGEKFYMLHRPMDWCGKEYGTDHPAMWISSANDLLAFGNSKLLAKATFPWELKIGGNTPPIKTNAGWLTIYHAVGNDKYYRLGAMLLDLKDPTKVTHRTKDWIFQPETDYETQGCYFGGGVVFPCGKVIIEDKLFVYYGAADKYVGLATCKVDDLLNYLLSCPIKD
ncbi:MAG TPA: glycosidase [Phycisphaerales bacterium]|nr:glycosidase [Phycisphaerales bacterium]